MPYYDWTSASSRRNAASRIYEQGGDRDNDIKYMPISLARDALLAEVAAEVAAIPFAVFNVRAFGAVGNGVADDLAAFTAANAAVVAAGGGILYVPPTAAFYRVSRAPLISPGVFVVGAGYGSYIKCVQATNEPVGGNAALVFGFVAREDMARQRTRGEGVGYFTVADVVTPSRVVTLDTPAQYSSFQSGDVVLVCSSDTWLASGQNYWDAADTTSVRPIPKYGLWSVVVSSAANGEVTLRHDVDPVVDPLILNFTRNTYNKRNPPWNAANALDATLYATRDSGAKNLRLEGGGTSTFPLFINGAVDCVFEDLWLVNAHEILRVNSLSHSVVQNIHGQFKGWGIELALNSSHNTIEDVWADYIEDGKSASTIPLLLGEGSHHNDVSAIWLNGGAHAGTAGVSFRGNYNRVGRVHLRAPGILNQTVSFGQGDGNSVVDSEFWTLGGDKFYWGASAGIDNRCSRNRSYGLGAGAAIKMVGGTRNECTLNFIEDEGVDTVGATLPVVRDNVLGTTAVTLRTVSAQATDIAREYYVTGEAHPRWNQRATGSMNWGGGTAVVDVNLYRIAEDRLGTDDQFRPDTLLLSEKGSDPAAVTDGAILFSRDNGSGKTQLCVRFATGAVQVLSTQP